MTDQYPLKAGTAWADVTPPAFTFMMGMGRERPRPVAAHDRLRARALILQSGDQKVALVTVDINYIDYDSINEVRRLVEAYTDIRGCDVRVTSSHSHSSPGYFRLTADVSYHPSWSDIVEEERSHVRSTCHLIAGAVYEANLRLEDAEIAFGEGTSRYNIVRWHQSAGGNMSFIPFHRKLVPNIEPLSDMFIFHVRRRADRKSLAFYYTNHAHAICVCLQSNLTTADYPGFVAELIEREYGGLCMYAPGGIGDQHPRDFDRGFDAARRMGRQLAGQIVRAQARMGYVSDVTLQSLEADVDLPDRSLKGEPLLPRTRTSVLAINGTAMNFWPGEAFGMIVRRLRAQSPFERTVVVSNTDDFKYYFALEEEYGRYRWEGDIALPNVYPPRGGDIVYDKALSLLRRADLERRQLGEYRAVAPEARSAVPVADMRLEGRRPRNST